MPKFIFQLQAVLKQRQAHERQRQLAVAALERERLAIEDEIRACQRALQHEQGDWRRSLASEGGGVVDVRDVRAQAHAALRVVARAQQAVLRLAGVHRRLDAARGDLLVATTARKGVEALRERRYEAWKMDLSRREASAMDELGVMRAGARAGVAGMTDQLGDDA